MKQGGGGDERDGSASSARLGRVGHMIKGNFQVLNLKHCLLTFKSTGVPRRDGKRPSYRSCVMQA